jgi:hypothetical protein
MIHLELAQKILDLDPMELSRILEEIARSNPDVIEELTEKVD